MGMAHGCYTFIYPDGREVYEAMNAAHATAYTEFGIPSPADADYLAAFIPEEDLFPPAPGGVWESHHAFGAWGGRTWLCDDIMEYYFGPAHNLQEMVERGQWLQCEGYKAIFEEARRQKPVCSMALNWCYNEPWPTAANNSLFSWPCRAKPAYFAVADACRPKMASARLPHFSYRDGEVFEPQLWLLNDAWEAIAAGSMTAVLEIGDREIHLLTWDHPGTAANENLAGPTLHYVLPCVEAEEMTLVVTLCETGAVSRYRLKYSSGKAKRTPPSRLLNL